MFDHLQAIMKFFTNPFKIPAFNKLIDDMTIAISAAPETFYYSDWAMEKQLDNSDGEA